jgi:hypothetical protein
MDYAYPFFSLLKRACLHAREGKKTAAKDIKDET